MPQPMLGIKRHSSPSKFDNVQAQNETPAPSKNECESAYEQYLRERDAEKNPPERDHTEILQEQLQKAAEVSK